jgi:hypothetical protein
MFLRHMRSSSSFHMFHLQAKAALHIITQAGPQYSGPDLKRLLQGLTEAEQAAVGATYIQRLLYHPDYVSCGERGGCQCRDKHVLSWPTCLPVLLLAMYSVHILIGSPMTVLPADCPAVKSATSSC